MEKRFIIVTDVHYSQEWLLCTIQWFSPNQGVVTLLLSIHDGSMHSLFSDIMFFGISSIPCNLGSFSNYWNTKNSTIERRHLLDFIWRWQWIAHKCLLRGFWVRYSSEPRAGGTIAPCPRFWQKQKQNILQWKPQRFLFLPTALVVEKSPLQEILAEAKSVAMKDPRNF